LSLSASGGVDEDRKVEGGGRSRPTAGGEVAGAPPQPREGNGWWAGLEGWRMVMKRRMESRRRSQTRAWRMKLLKFKDRRGVVRSPYRT
jgi:hypothetical protein